MAAFRSRYRRGGRWWGLGTTLAAAAVALLFVALAGAAKPPAGGTPSGPFPVPNGPLSVAAGFEGNDANTPPGDPAKPSGTPAPTGNGGYEINYDWNSLATNPTYLPDGDYGQASGTTTNGWQWLAMKDAQKSTTDTGFGGGVKQDDNCATVQGGSAPNKDDLKRAYVAARTGTDGHTYLELGWVRIPQNTTSSSAHIAFEFNQSDTACPPGSDGLVERSSGDLLLLYDFTGGSTVPPHITLSRWLGPIDSGSCGVSSHSKPCWGAFTDLSSASEAEANVDTGLSHLCQGTTGCGPNESDVNTSNPSNGTTYQLPSSTSDSLANPTEMLGASEFGEATVDLTAAQIFTGGTCTSFGQVEAVSRSSGDSGTAAMEDLVGPGQFTLSNCATIKIIKHTNPRGTDKGFSYSTNIASNAANTCATTATACFSKTPVTTGSTTTFTLNDKFGSVAISSISVGDPTTVTTASAHGLTTGDTVTISGSDSTPSINGTYTVTVTGTTTFTIPVAVTGAGTTGTEVSNNSTNTETITNVAPGSYTVTETVPGGWVLETLLCSPSSGTSFGAPNGTTANEADITVVAEGSVTCTFTNAPTTGAILVTKTGKDKNCTGSITDAPGNSPGTSDAIGTCTATNALVNLKGATFEVWKENGKQSGFQSTGTNADDLVATQTTPVGGTTCFNALSFSGSSDYYVNEKTAPSGYQTDDTDSGTTGVQTFKKVTVSTSAKCSDDPFVGNTVSFSDTPLSKIEVKFSSTAATGVTTSTITCYQEDGITSITPDSGSTTGSDQSYSGLVPNSTGKNYSCTINIDP